MPGAARLNDVGKGDDCFPDTPVIAGSPDVIINGQPAARLGDAVAIPEEDYHLLEENITGQI